MKKEKTQLFCPNCGEDGALTCEVRQSVDVEVFSNGDIENGFDFSEPEVDEGSLYCAVCGVRLEIAKDYLLKERKHEKI